MTAPLCDMSWLARFPDLTGLDASAQRQLAGGCRLVRVPSGTRIFAAGDQPHAYILALSGTVRVQKASESGREIVLYRVSPGETCVLTTACLIGREPYEAEAIAESDVEAALVSQAAFEQLLAADDAFRRFVFTSFSGRITDLLRLIDQVAFARMDVRLAQKLLELANASGTIAMTQQQLAAELGTAREVVSRQLHELQREGAITVSRGTIAIDDQERLRALVRQI